MGAMLARWNPWDDLFDTRREFDDLLRQAFGRWGRSKAGNGTSWTPAVDVFAREGDLVVRAELPGIDPEKDVDISLQDGYLTIQGQRRYQQKTERKDYYRVETSYGAFSRTIALPEGVKEDDIKATYENGILEVVVPKAAELTSPKRIPISAGSEQQKAVTTSGEKVE